MKNLFFLSAFLVVLSSCEKVIEVDLDDHSGQYVIEGQITDQDASSFVTISKTASFGSTGGFEKVNDAQVILRGPSGMTDTLRSIGNGKYSGWMKGEELKTYTLEVTISGKKFTAQSTMPPAVSFDTLTVLKITSGPQYLIPVYRDPSNTKNFYRFKTFINGNASNYINVRNDDFTNGNKVTDPLYNIIGTHDTAKVQMWCIDEAVYKYFYSLDQIAGMGESATPANPVSNFRGGCLGYFSAHTLRERTVVIP